MHDMQNTLRNYDMHDVQNNLGKHRQHNIIQLASLGQGQAKT